MEMVERDILELNPNVSVLEELSVSFPPFVRMSCANFFVDIFGNATGEIRSNCWSG